MGTFFAWFLAAIGPLTGRVLATLGFTAITVVGVEATFATALGHLTQHIGSAPLAVLQLAGLGGVWEAGGIIVTAMTFCLTYWALTKASRFAMMPAAPSA